MNVFSPLPHVNFAHKVVSLLLLCCTHLSCSQPQVSGRDAWLANTLIEDHFHLVSRSAELVAGKFQKMLGLYDDDSSSLYPYMRGTLAQMYRDLGGDYQQVIPSQFASSDGVLVLLVGDPHLENLSSHLNDSGQLILDWDDFDSAGYGPWIWDLRRLALCLWVLCYDMGVTDISETIMQALSTGYLQGVYDWQIGQRAQPSEGQLLPITIKSFFKKVRQKEADRALLTRYTEFNQEQRLFKRGLIKASKQKGVIKDALLNLNDKEQIMIKNLVSHLKSLKNDLGTLKDQVRKYGQGVSSYPLMRFYLLFEGASASPNDDEIWEVKELADRPAPPELPLYPPRQFGAQGERVIEARRKLQWRSKESIASLSPSTWIDIGQFSFRVRQLSETQKGLSTDDLMKSFASLIEDGKYDNALKMIEELAHLSGRLLAGAHCHAPALNGRSGGEIITESLQLASNETLATELIDFSAIYGAQIELDRAYLLALLNQRGPLLGMRHVAQ